MLGSSQCLKSHHAENSLDCHVHSRQIVRTKNKGTEKLDNSDQITHLQTTECP